MTGGKLTTAYDIWARDRALGPRGVNGAAAAPAPVPISVLAVSYRKVSSRPNYSSEAVEATAAVLPDQNATDVLAELKAWVLGELDPPKPEIDLDETPF